MSEYVWLNDASRHFLEKDYLLPGQTVDERVDIICNRAEEILGLPGYASKLKQYIQRGWYSLSTPVWVNFGTVRGLPISCYNTHISDDMHSIIYAQAEIGIMTKFGGGTSAYFGELRPRGSVIKDNGYSSGPVSFMELFQTSMKIISQGSARRGNFAAYLPVDHPDIYEFLSIKSEGHPIQDISFGVCVPDGWMQSMIDGDKDKRGVWAKILQTRANTGYPYISFMDNINNNAPDVYKDKNIEIKSQNLCNEIALKSDENESFVCDLSSMNILHYDDWKNTDAVQTLVYFLDAIMTEFIEKAEKIPFLERAVNFAKRQRALGVGWLGWHSYLQSKSIPFESMEAKLENTKIAKTIQEKAVEASRKLAKQFGEPELLKGYGRRNVTLTAIAPTKSSAFIIGQVSEGIEPHRSNYYIKDLQKGKFTVKNPYLVQVLDRYNKNSDVVWQDILKNNGSVQHLDFLSEHEKSVFKTFQEISPLEVIIQAAQRQKYVDQGQSLNLMIHPNTPTKDINKLLIEAWKLGVKGLYYQISVNAAQELSRNILTCSSCES